MLKDFGGAVLVAWGDSNSGQGRRRDLDLREVVSRLQRKLLQWDYKGKRGFIPAEKPGTRGGQTGQQGNGIGLQGKKRKKDRQWCGLSMSRGAWHWKDLSAGYQTATGGKMPKGWDNLAFKEGRAKTQPQMWRRPARLDLMREKGHDYGASDGGRTKMVRRWGVKTVCTKVSEAPNATHGGPLKLSRKPGWASVAIRGNVEWTRGDRPKGKLEFRWVNY